MKIERKELDRLNNEADHYLKLIRANEVSSLTGLSKSYIYELCDKGLFPKSLRLVPGGTSIAWVKGEILDWIESRKQSRNEVD
jgi:prophage regulatory protein